MSLAGVTFSGEAFSEYFCTKLLPTDPVLRGVLDALGADEIFKVLASELRQAARELRGRIEPRSTDTLLLARLAKLLGWRLGERNDVVTDLGEEEDGGRPLFVGADDKVAARVICSGPHDHLDAPPSGFHRRFAPSHALPRVLKEENLAYGVLLNGYRLRLLCRTGAVPSSIEFDLGLIAEGQEPGQRAWRLLFGLLRGDAWSSEPPVIERVRIEGKQHQERVSSDLGQQIQRAVVRFMQGVLDHPANKEKLPLPVTPEFLGKLYQQTLRLLYRLLFVLYAEDLHLLPMDVSTYREGYSLARLTRLARTIGEQSLEQADPNGIFFESALKSLFALLRVGVNLGPEGEIRPYAGGLFDPKATEMIDALAWGNSTIDHVLEFLRFVPAPRREGWIPLSYRELNVEQLGAIYEGLLELSPAYADKPRWRAKLDGDNIYVDAAMRKRLAGKRGEVLCDENFHALQEQPDLDMIAGDDDDGEEEDADALLDESTDEEASESGDGGDDDEQEAEEDAVPAAKRSKKPLRVVETPIRPGTVFLRGGAARKQSGSYYTNRVLVDFLVHTAVDPLARNKTPTEILSLRCADLAMGSGHFLVGVCRRLGVHLLAAYRRLVAETRKEAATDEENLFSEDDILLLADVPDDLRRAWPSADEERLLAACRLLVAGNCIYGVDKNPLAVDLAKVSIWLSVAAARQPLTFLDHRLVCGDSLLGLPAEELVRRYIPRTVKGKTWAAYPTLLSDEKSLKDNLYTVGREQLCTVLQRGFALLGLLNRSVAEDPANFEAHRTAHAVLGGHLRLLFELHALRVGLAFSPVRGHGQSVSLPDQWLEALAACKSGHLSVPDALRTASAELISRGEQLNAHCWELAFPEVFFAADGERRADAGFDVLVGNPPWDKVKPTEKEYFSQFDPTILDEQAQGAKALVRDIISRNPETGPGWEKHRAETNLYKQKLTKDGLYVHQTDKVPHPRTGKPKTTGGDADLFKIFTERFFKLLTPGYGRLSILTPGALYSSEGAKGLRRMLLEHSQLECLYSFENKHQRFFPNVHPSQKFCTVSTMRQKPDPKAEFPCAFLLHDATWLDAPPERQVSRRVMLSPAFIAEQSPTHLSFFEFRSEKEKTLVKRLYEQFPPLGKKIEGTWNVEFTTELHMTQDSWLFRERDRLRAFGGEQHPGEYWTLPERDWFEAQPERFVWVQRDENELRGKEKHKPGRRRRDADDEARVFEGYVLRGEEDEKSPQIMVPAGKYVPLYEGRMVHQFDHAAKAYVSGSGRSAKWDDQYNREKNVVPHYFVHPGHSLTVAPTSARRRVAYCSVTGQTNERTCLLSFLPSECPGGHSLSVMASGTEEEQSIFLGLSNSFWFDWLMRLRVSMNLSFFFWLSIPTPRPTADEEDATSILEAVGVLNLDRSAAARSQVDVHAAKLFQLDPATVAGVIANFPLLDRDMPPLPGDGFIAYDARSNPKFKPRSFITRDKVLLAYFRLLGQTPPTDIVAFFADAGVDIDGSRVLAGEPPADPFNPPIYATGSIRNLEVRVAEAEKRGAVAYVPTTRKKWDSTGPYLPPDLPESLKAVSRPALSPWVLSDPQTLGGKEVLAGTRLSVDMIYSKLQQGWTFKQLRESFPQLTDELIAVAFCWGSLA